MAEMKLYEYDVNGVTHVAQLSEEDADRYGRKALKEVSGGASATERPATGAKARTPANK